MQPSPLDENQVDVEQDPATVEEDGPTAEEPREEVRCSLRLQDSQVQGRQEVVHHSDVALVLLEVVSLGNTKVAN